MDWTVIAASRRGMLQPVGKAVPVVAAPVVSAMLNRDYILRGRLGRGAYGIVYDAYEKHSGARVAIKRMLGVFTCDDEEEDEEEEDEDETCSQDEEEDETATPSMDAPLEDATGTEPASCSAIVALREIKLLRMLAPHPHIVRLQGLLLNPASPDVYAVFERMDMTLHDLVKSRRPHALGADARRALLCQLLQGLVHIHQAGVLHRDLKPQNVLVNLAAGDHPRLKIADFGLARAVLEPADQCQGWTDYVTTRWYRAPEVLMGHTYTCALDVWSVGCMAAEMAMGGEVMFPGVRTLRRVLELLGRPPAWLVDEVQSPRVRSLLLAVPEHLPQDGDARRARLSQRLGCGAADPEFIDLLDRLLDIDPRSRCTASQALLHPYFKGVLPPAGGACPGSLRWRQREFAFDDPGRRDPLTMGGARALLEVEAQLLQRRHMSMRATAQAAATVP